MSVKIDFTDAGNGFFWGSLGAYDYSYETQFKRVTVMFAPGNMNLYGKAATKEEAANEVIALIIKMQNKLIPINVNQIEKEQGK